MTLHKHLDNNPSLYIFLPILHIAWSDSVLTPSEMENMRQFVDKQAWMNNEECELIKKYLNPKTPPPVSEMKEWLAQIREMSDQFDQSHKSDLIHIGIELAKKNGYEADKEAQEKVIKSLSAIENALGIVSEESYRFLFTDIENITEGKRIESPHFNVGDMTSLLEGDHSDIIRKVKKVLLDPKFEYYEGEDTAEYREKVLVWCKHLADQGFGSMAFPKEYSGGGDMARYFTIMETLSYHDLSLVIKFGVQFGLFGMSVYFLGTEKHHAKYLEKIGDLTLPGSFAMTETGHGSNVRDIETTATFNALTRTFVVNTPNDLARKDYIGNAACHAQMATVFAKLVIAGVDYGVNAFLVPIRDKTGKLISGVRVEDCGKKMGLNGVDNGRIWFDQVEIPYDNMLDRYATVSEKNEFESPIASDSRRFFTMLGTLVGGRIGIPRSALSATKSSLAIAINYGEKRTQFGPENGEEIPILDYRTHQRRLMPLLANSYALHFSLQYLTNRFLNKTEEDIREIEALAAGLKAFTTWNATATLQTCREACGGKGFLSENRIGDLKNDTEIYTTFEGDNTVLMQLVAKSRLTDFKQEFHDINVFGIINYISSQAMTAITEMNPIITRNTSEEHLLDPEFQLNAFKYRERDILTSAAKRLKKHIGNGMDSFQAFNQCQFHLLNVGFAHIERIVLEQFIAQVENTPDLKLKETLKRLCDLFALSQIEKNKGWYLEHGYMEGVKTKAIRQVVNRLCYDVRRESIPLVDAFDIPDSCLGAPIAFGDFE